MTVWPLSTGSLHDLGVSVFSPSMIICVVVGAAVCVLGVTFYCLLIRIRMKREAVRNEMAEKIVPQQINDLFLYNTLQNLSVVIQNDVQTANKILEDLSQFLHMLSEMRKQKVAILAQEIRLVEDYLKVERARLGQRLSVRRDIDPHCLEVQVPVFLLLPLIENCILHGTEKHSEPVTIFISIQCRDQKLYIEISDTGTGIDPKKLSSVLRNGRTLAYLSKRLKGEFGKKAQIHMENLAPSGTRVTITIPAKIINWNNE